MVKLFASMVFLIQKHYYYKTPAQRVHNDQLQSPFSNHMDDHCKPGGASDPFPPPRVCLVGAARVRGRGDSALPRRRLFSLRTRGGLGYVADVWGRMVVLEVWGLAVSRVGG